jgi:hypothetical protein
MATSRVRRLTDTSAEHPEYQRGMQDGLLARGWAYALWGAVTGFLVALALAAYLDLFRVLAGCLGAGR